MFSARSKQLFLWALVGGLTFPLEGRAVPLVSADRINQVVTAIASDDTLGRNNLSRGADLARSRLIDIMRDLGLEPAGSSGFEQPFEEGVNLLARCGGDDPDIVPIVLLGAHYDHLGLDCESRAEASSRVCNGASDNAGGVAAVLSAMEVLCQTSSFPVGAALWDAEEDGLLGSEYFVATPPYDLDALSLYINLDIVGLDLFRGAEQYHFAVGAESGGERLLSTVLEAADGLPLSLSPLSYAFGMGRSDMSSFISAGLPIPIVFLGDGDGAGYHTTTDEIAYLNFSKIEAVANVAARVAEEAVVSGGYPYQEPGAMPLYADALELRELYTVLVAVADQNELTEQEKADVASHLQALDRIVRLGAGRFGATQALQVATSALYALSLSANLPFMP